MKRIHSIAAMALAGGLAASGAQAAQVYTKNFENGSLGAEWSGGGAVASSDGLAAFGFGELHLRNDGTSATVLTLSGLAAHSELTLDFSLAMWDSIDLGGDRFVITIDGVDVYDDNVNFGNYFPAENAGRGPGSQITPAFTSFTEPGLGFNPGFRDSARTVSFTVAHSASSVVISWQFPNSQGGMDESFGLDNVVVSTNPVSTVPLPASLPLLGLGVAGLAALRARRSSRA